MPLTFAHLPLSLCIIVAVSLTEIEKARKVAERALKAISFRSPQEKLNVWIALLNLENMYGTQKTMQEVFNRAVQFNDPMTVYMEVAKIYASTKKVEVSLLDNVFSFLPSRLHPGVTDEQLYLIFPNSLYWRFAAHTVEENFPPDPITPISSRNELNS